MGKKVLTVDDSKTLRMIVARNLRPFGVEILEAENGSVGIARAISDKPDLILLDYNMPVMDGFQTLEALKKDPATKGIPVVMLTTETVKETVVKLIKLGLKDFIAKPFSREALLQKVNPILALYEGDAVPEMEANPERGAQEQAPDLSGKKIVMAVDDKENVLRLLKEFLGEDYHVLTAANGQSAISLIPTASFEVLFLDMDMPDISGTEVYKKMKGAIDAKHAKVVGMVLRTAQSEIASAKQVGIKEFLYKPFTKADVAALCASIGENSSASGAGTGRKWFLPADGNVQMLSFPQEDDPSLKIFANALGTDIRKELSDMADEGVNRLVIKLTPAVVTDCLMVKRFVGLLDLVNTLTLSVKLVAEDEKTQEKLQQFSETARMKTFKSLDLALKSFS